MQISKILIVFVVSIYQSDDEQQENVQNGNKRGPIFKFELNQR